MPAQQTQAPAPAQPEGLSLSDLVEMVENAEDATYESRKMGDICRRYYHNKQITKEERDELRKRGQPEVMDNVIRRKIKFLKGWERQSRSDPKAFPRNSPEDDDAGEAATDALRFQEQAGFLDQLFSEVWEDMLIPGFGGLEVLGPNARDPRVIEVKLWRWDRLGYDPHSAADDFSDATYFYGVTWMDKTDAINKWPQSKAGLERVVSEEVTRSGHTYQDKPNNRAWATRGKRERIKIIQMYYRMPVPNSDDYTWHWCVFSKGGKIDGGLVELNDQYGMSDCPMLLQSAYVDEENNRYGEVVEMLTMQDAINKRESKLVHLLNSHQTIGEQGAILDVDEFKAQMARPDGHGELAPGALENKRFQTIDKSQEINGHVALLQEARNRFELMGPNATLSGKQQGVASGRAIRASQEGGLIELTDLKDKHTHLKRRVYRALWNRIRQFWTEESWVRVTDNDDSVRFVGFNRQVTGYEDLLEQAKKEGIEEAEAQAQIKMAIDQNPMLKQQLEQVVRTANVPAEMDVDIIVDVSTESINMQEETFQTLSNLFPPGALPPEVILELAPISPKKRRQIKEMLEPKPAEVEQEQMVQQVKGDNIVADTEAKRAKATRDQADAMQKVTQTQIAAMTPIVPPQQLPVSGESEAFIARQ